MRGIVKWKGEVGGRGRERERNADRWRRKRGAKTGREVDGVLEVDQERRGEEGRECFPGPRTKFSKPRHLPGDMCTYL